MRSLYLCLGVLSHPISKAELQSLTGTAVPIIHDRHIRLSSGHTRSQVGCQWMSTRRGFDSALRYPVEASQ